jgi:hypothetical protein
LQEPSYASIYPIGQGIVLAFGQLLFHQPWIGVLLSVGVLSALCYWMLRAWVPPSWALLGGLLAGLQFGPLSSWMNSYWGGGVSAVAGCLIFGSLPKLRQSASRWPAILLGAGLGIQLLTRPYEFALLLPALLFFRPPVRAVAVAALVLIPAAGITLLQNKMITGSWLTLPYQLSRYQYGIPTTFTIEPNPAPHHELTIEQKVDYADQVAVHGAGTDTLSTYMGRLITRIRFYRFFFFPALFVTLPVFVFAWRDRRWIAVIGTLGVLWIGDTFYPYFYPHYIAVACCLFVLLAVESLRLLSHFRAGPQIATLVLAFCVGHFVYALTPGGANDYWNALNAPDPEGRASIQQRLETSPGSQLVFVRYGTPHREQEWVHNAADIDRARTIWAVDRGDAENIALRRYYPDRHAWLLEPDTRPVRLTPLPTRLSATQ